MRQRRWNILYTGTLLGGTTTSMEHVVRTCGIDLPRHDRVVTPLDLTVRRSSREIAIRVLHDFRSNLAIGRLATSPIFDEPPKPTTPDEVFAFRRWDYVVAALRQVVAFLPIVDGIVFVVDSQRERLEALDEHVHRLREDLTDATVDPSRLSLVFQLNKRDLKNAAAVDVLRQHAQWPGPCSYVESVAPRGTGVIEALNALLDRIASVVRPGTSLDR